MSQPRKPRKQLSAFALLVLLILLFMPFLAGFRIAQSMDPWPFAGYTLAICLLTFFKCRHDKLQAGSGGWRTPESTLHLLELLGGWPASFLAQRIFRHKTSKTAYQNVFWIIVAVHQAVAFDLLCDWKFSLAAIDALQEFLPNPPTP